MHCGVQSPPAPACGAWAAADSQRGRGSPPCCSQANPGERFTGLDMLTRLLTPGGGGGRGTRGGGSGGPLIQELDGGERPAGGGCESGDDGDDGGDEWRMPQAIGDNAGDRATLCAPSYGFNVSVPT